MHVSGHVYVAGCYGYFGDLQLAGLTSGLRVFIGRHHLLQQLLSDQSNQRVVAQDADRLRAGGWTLATAARTNEMVSD